MRILGIDPGVATIGFGLVEAQRSAVRLLQYGVITTPAGLPLSARLFQISQDLSQLLGQFRPDEAAVEELFLAMNITTGLLKMKAVPRPDDAADALAIAICHGRSATSLLNTERIFDPRKYDTR